MPPYTELGAFQAEHLRHQSVPFPFSLLRHKLLLPSPVIDTNLSTVATLETVKRRMLGH